MQDPLLDEFQRTIGESFRLERRLHAGAYGNVLLATDAAGRKVVLSIVREELVSNASDRGRMLVELALIKRLRHPHVLPILDSGEARGQVYYSTPFIVGGSLRLRLDEGPLPLELALRIGDEVAEAVTYAHAHGVVHRDLTPDNILLDAGRRAVVKGFWVARALKSALAGKLTAAGFAIGTPDYVSPEQALGEPAGERSDVYSLAVLLCEMLANELPFKGSHASEILQLKVRSDLSAKDLPARLPRGMASAIAKGLARLPKDRFATAKELVDACRGPAARRIADASVLADLPVLAPKRGSWLSRIGRLFERRPRPLASVFPVHHAPDASFERLRQALQYQYDLHEEIGRGGMAMVYLARDLRYRDRRVAVKVLRPEYAVSLMSERFLQEIEITAQLTHPAILPLFDSGDAAGMPFYVMPYVEGETLLAKIEREGRLSLGDTLSLTRDVAQALDYAHRSQIVHRDIKPENILLHEGRAMVADFGIALAMDRSRERHTQPGYSPGTPAFMSPEQFSGATIDHRSDLYSLGCVVYEMLVGAAPFGGPFHELSNKHLYAPVPHVRATRPEIPEAVDAAICKVMAKMPSDRFDSAPAFVAALTQPGTA